MEKCANVYKLLEERENTTMDEQIIDNTPGAKLNDCYNECVKVGNTTTAICIKECSSLKKGFTNNVYYSSKDVDPTGSTGELMESIDQLENDFIGGLITGRQQTAAGAKDKILGKNYAYPMDFKLNLPFMGDALNADCIKPDGTTTTRHMYIRGIPVGDVAKHIGLNLHIPEAPDHKYVGAVWWKQLFRYIGGNTDVGEKKGKQMLEPVLIELKRKCRTFLYDVQVNAEGVWDPKAKLKIPPGCEESLKRIDPKIYKILKDYPNSNIISGSLRGLIPSIVEDVIDLNPLSLARKSGLTSNESSGELEKCKYITAKLGEQRYSDDGDLKPYTFEVFTNYNMNEKIKEMCMLIVIVVLFLFIF